MRKAYRPWGPLLWTLDRLAAGPWALISVAGTEDRSVAVKRNLTQSNLITSLFLRIEDPDPADPEKYKVRLDETQAQICRNSDTPVTVRQVELLEAIDVIDSCAQEIIASSQGKIIVDITCMPKYWFFPLLRFLTESAQVTDLIVTYASAEKYAEHISSNPRPLAELPTFDGEKADAVDEDLIVAIGFAPLGLKDLFSTRINRVKYMFPFPPGPPHDSRNWEFLRELQEQVEYRNPAERRSYSPRDDRWHVHMYDCPANFDALCRFSFDGAIPVALAPFGPKTVSLAMCLFALAVERETDRRTPVHYTQPMRYALDYTTGIRNTNGVDDIRAYCVKSRGRYLYQLSHQI